MENKPVIKSASFFMLDKKIDLYVFFVKPIA
jgi:hypothetical protein